jgi:hypothetical protein
MLIRSHNSLGTLVVLLPPVWRRVKDHFGSGAEFNRQAPSLHLKHQSLRVKLWLLELMYRSTEIAPRGVPVYVSSRITHSLESGSRRMDLW